MERSAHTSSDAGAGVPRLGEVLEASDAIGVLARDIQVRLVNISASGCLIETSGRLETGTIGVLRLHAAGGIFTDGVRVTRVQGVAGRSAAWQVGVEFLWTTYPGARSLRRMARRLGREAFTGRVELEVSGRVRM
jgi:hypothetical protein